MKLESPEEALKAMLGPEINALGSGHSLLSAQASYFVLVSATPLMADCRPQKSLSWDLAGRPVIILQNFNGCSIVVYKMYKTVDYSVARFGVFLFCFPF